MVAGRGSTGGEKERGREGGNKKDGETKHRPAVVQQPSTTCSPLSPYHPMSGNDGREAPAQDLCTFRVDTALMEVNVSLSTRIILIILNG